MQHKFGDSLQIGKAGETMFHAAMPHLKRLNGYDADFIDVLTNETYELKSDSYDMQKTQNFFIEVLSDVARNKPGGPFQSLQKNVTYFVYMYTKNKICYTFKTAELVNWLKEYLASEAAPAAIDIENTTWTTSGIKLPRNLVAHLYTERQL